MKTNRKIQIGVMGSASDLGYGNEVKKLASEVGRIIAENGAVLVFGAEKDCDSLSTIACRGAKMAGGLTLGITYGKDKLIYEKSMVDIIVPSGVERGGGRELTLVLSCDAIIALGGGSGTLTEIAIAYQMNIPVVVVSGTGGWSDKLKGLYLDERKRFVIESANTPEEAVKKALKLIRK